MRQGGGDTGDGPIDAELFADIDRLQGRESVGEDVDGDQRAGVRL